MHMHVVLSFFASLLREVEIMVASMRSLFLIADIRAGQAISPEINRK